VSDAVVVVGPKVIRGPGEVDPELASVALECIDDELALLQGRAVPAAEVWRTVLGSAISGPRDEVVLICPSWWADSRVERVEAAAREWCGTVVFRPRVEVLTAARTVVELAPELVVVHAGEHRRAIARSSQDGSVVPTIAACVAGLDAVVIDAPSGLARLGADLGRTLRSRCADVTVVDDDVLVRTATDRQARRPATPTPSRRRGVGVRATAALAAALSVAALAAAGLAIDTDPEDDIGAVAWLVEGRVAVEVPARWTVERITSGPGSARVQVVSPSTPFDVIALVQSRVPDAQTLEETASALRDALADEPDGVFVDFVARDEHAQRPAVTYREIRADRQIAWTVLLDGGVRIAIGCQGSVARPGPEPQCERSVRSAHAVA
jgi:type VII secretion-associated protein (TIGR03931 family)